MKRKKTILIQWVEYTIIFSSVSEWVMPILNLQTSKKIFIINFPMLCLLLFLEFNICHVSKKKKNNARHTLFYICNFLTLTQQQSFDILTLFQPTFLPCFLWSVMKREAIAVRGENMYCSVSKNVKSWRYKDALLSY